MTEPVNLMTLENIEEKLQDPNKRVEELFHSGDAVRVTTKGNAIHIENFARRYQGAGETGSVFPIAPLDDECRIVADQQDPKSVIIVNPTAAVVKDLLSTTKWESVQLVDSVDYLPKQEQEKQVG